MSLHTSFITLFVLGLFASLVSGQRCFDQIEFNYFSCEQTCTPLESSLDLINRCDRLARFGCELNRCDGDTGVECVGPSRSKITTCGNSRIVFQDGDDDASTIAFQLDLNTPPVKGDYYFLVNARLAMKPFLPNLKKSIIDFITSVNGSTEVRFGVGIYRNEDMLDMGFKDLLSLTNNHEQARNAANDITLAFAKGGPDANLQAINKAVKQDFRADAKKIIFLLGNTPGHEPSKVGDGDVLTRETVANTLKDAGITLVGINFSGRNGLDSPTGSFGISPAVDTEGNQASFIAQETGGVVVFRTKTVFDAFWRAKANVERVYNITEGDCAPFISRVAGGSSFPVTIAKGKSAAVVSLSFKLNSGLCTPFSCKLGLTENGMEIQPLMLEVPSGTNTTCSSSSN